MNKTTYIERIENVTALSSSAKKDIEFIIGEITEQARQDERDVIRDEANKLHEIHLKIEEDHSRYPKDWHEGNRNALMKIIDFINKLEKVDSLNKK